MNVRGSSRGALAAAGAAALLLFGAAGCATKKHVRQVMAPVETRVSELEARNKSLQGSVTELEASVARTDERAMEADSKAARAGEEAARAAQAAANAGQTAADAGQAAATAQQMAGKNEVRLGGVETALSNLDNYTLAAEERILFGFDRWQLSDEARARIGRIAAGLQGKSGYVFEVQGFTDHTGASAYNLELSRKRAQAVVRHLTLDHGVPLRRIHVLGAGEAPGGRTGTRGAPAADRETRRQDRRVELRVYTLNLSGGGTQVSAAQPPR